MGDCMVVCVVGANEVVCKVICVVCSVFGSFPYSSVCIFAGIRMCSGLWHKLGVVKSVEGGLNLGMELLGGV